MKTNHWWQLRLISRDNDTGTGTGTGTGAGAGAGAGGSSGAGAGSGAGGGSGSGDGDRKFTQEQLNAAVARERREQQERAQAQLAVLEKIKADGLTPEDKQSLNKQIADLRAATATVEELAKQKLTAREQEWATERAQLVAAREQATQRLETLTVQTLFDTAMNVHSVKPGATGIVSAFLHANLVKVPGVDAAGKPTNTTEYKIDMSVLDPQTKEAKTLRLAPADAVAQMRQQPDFAPLFAASARSGTGSAGSSGAGAPDWKTMSQAEYMRLRKESPQTLGLRPS